MEAKKYRNRTSGEIISSSEYWDIQIERYFNEANEEEKDDLSQTYGTKAIKVWVRFNPDANFEEYVAEAVFKGTIPPKRERNIEPDTKPVAMPPKRNTGAMADPSNRSGRSVPPKRQVMERPQTALPVVAPPKRTPQAIKQEAEIFPVPAPPKRASAKISEEAQRKEMRENLWRMAKEDPYYNETPTDDDGVYGNGRKMEKNKMLLAAAFIVIILAGITAIVYVVITM